MARASPAWVGFAASGLGGRLHRLVLPPAKAYDAWLQRAFSSRLQLALAAVAVGYVVARVRGRLETWSRRVERMGTYHLPPRGVVQPLRIIRGLNSLSPAHSPLPPHREALRLRVEMRTMQRARCSSARLGTGFAEAASCGSRLAPLWHPEGILTVPASPFAVNSRPPFAASAYGCISRKHHRGGKRQRRQPQTADPDEEDIGAVVVPTYSWWDSRVSHTPSCRRTPRRGRGRKP